MIWPIKSMAQPMPFSAEVQRDGAQAEQRRFDCPGYWICKSLVGLWQCFSGFPAVVCVSLPQAALYLAGFPCTPYSTLGGRECLRDPNAKQLVACIRRIKECRPKVPQQIKTMIWIQCCRLFLKICFGPTKVAILENVLGFLSVLGRVCTFIERNCPGSLT